MHRCYRSLVVVSVLCLACGQPDPLTTADATTTTATTTGHAEDGHSETGATLTPTTTGPGPTTTATTTDPGTGTSPGESTVGADFIVTPDYLFGEDWGCDVFAQDCSPGEKCVAWASDGGSAWNATKCVPVTGDQLPGDECTAESGGINGIDDCAFGAMCWDVEMDTGKGICIALCTGTPDAPFCAEATSCAIKNDGVLNLCLPDCDPLLGDCPGDDLCVPNDDGFVCVLDASGDGGQLNQPCGFANSCDKGLVCLPATEASAACDPDAGSCCQNYCEFMIGMDGDCPNPDQKCVQWFDPMMEIPPGLEDVGVCKIPA